MSTSMVAYARHQELNGIFVDWQIPCKTACTLLKKQVPSRSWVSTKLGYANNSIFRGITSTTLATNFLSAKPISKQGTF